jgi:hypothetical protein
MPASSRWSFRGVNDRLVRDAGIHQQAKLGSAFAQLGANFLEPQLRRSGLAFRQRSCIKRQQGRFVIAPSTTVIRISSASR